MKRNPAENLYLDHWCRLIALTFDAPVYLVGSALESAEPNDIDLRCVLDDSDAIFTNELRHWFMNCLFSEFLLIRAGIEIDFQFQRRSDAFEGNRRPMGVPITCGAEYQYLNAIKGIK